MTPPRRHDCSRPTSANAAPRRPLAKAWGGLGVTWAGGGAAPHPTLLGPHARSPSCSHVHVVVLLLVLGGGDRAGGVDADGDGGGPGGRRALLLARHHHHHRPDRDHTEEAQPDGEPDD